MFKKINNLKIHQNIRCANVQYYHVSQRTLRFKFLNFNY